MKAVFALMAVLVLAGCATRSGRVSAVDLDFRDPEQINAYAYEAEVPYAERTATTNGPPVTVQSSTFPWQSMFDFLGIAKFRLRLLTFEWVNKENP